MSNTAIESPGSVSRPSSAVTLPGRGWSGWLAALLVLAPALYLAQMWLGYRESWLHPELLGTSEYIWALPETERFPDRLRKMFDWKAFDPNVNRVRPLNDAAETIDAIARPYLSRIAPPRPSITPVALLTAVLSPLTLYRFLRGIGLENVRAAALIAVFLSSIGFLSITVAYIRPAKKLVILLLCVSLYFAHDHAQRGSLSSFWALISSLFVSLFADEMALASYCVVAALFLPSLVLKAPNWKRLAFLSLPILFLVVTNWVLPAFYERFSVHGPWNALADSKKFTVFGYLGQPYFYQAGLIHTARAFLTTVGVQTHGTISELIAILLLTAGTGLLLYRAGRAKDSTPAHYPLLASTVILFAVGFYATLLDWYPFPEQVSYLGSFTYYYHSALGLLVILWLAFAWQVLSHLVRGRAVARRAIVAGGVALCAIVTVANLAMFHNVNRLVQLIHTYPYSTDSIHRQILAKLPEIRASQPGDVIAIEFAREPETLSNEFDASLWAIFGAHAQETDFSTLFDTFKSKPIMLDRHLGDLLHAYFPYQKFTVSIS